MSVPTPIVHIVDDDESFRNALARMLRATNHTVQTYACAADFLAQAALGEPGCVIVDLHMPRTNGLELQERLAVMEDPLPVIFLTGRGDIPSTVLAIRRGAEDFLTKVAPKSEILDAVGRAIARDAAEKPLRRRRRDARARIALLSAREREVLAFVVRGFLNKQIADELGIHERTVKLHRTSITTKLGVPSVAELTRLVQEAGYGAGEGLAA